MKTSITFFIAAAIARSFQYKWIEKYAWLVYSKAVYRGFCRFCALFARLRSKLSVLVNKAFVTWVKVHKVTHNVCT